MVKNKEKHQIAFCVSAFTLLAGLSLIATGIAVGTVPAIASCFSERRNSNCLVYCAISRKLFIFTKQRKSFQEND
ncbi:hypothetical protein [Wolbachia endosymbiont of Nasonia giraulti]|uniref:hypothetical protein n=1 Tax=Wolbachia endosymbiont of Nasonia giraulti TaxID=180838 RepID=UPI003A8A53E9